MVTGNDLPREPPRLDEWTKLKDEVRVLREEKLFHDDFMVKVGELIPEGYDGDESIEAILMRYLKDMEQLAGIIARLTSAFR